MMRQLQLTQRADGCVGWRRCQQAEHQRRTDSPHECCRRCLAAPAAQAELQERAAGRQQQQHSCAVPLAAAAR
jgi:hypothetical protein